MRTVEDHRVARPHGRDEAPDADDERDLQRPEHDRRMRRLPSMLSGEPGKAGARQMQRIDWRKQRPDADRSSKVGAGGLLREAEQSAQQALADGLDVRATL